MSRKEDQGRFVVTVPDDVTPGRPVNYLNVNVHSGNVVLDLGFMQPMYPGQEKPEAVITFRGGTNVAFLRVAHQILTGLLKQIDQDQQAPPAGAPPAAGGQVVN